MSAEATGIGQDHPSIRRDASARINAGGKYVCERVDAAAAIERFHEHELACDQRQHVPCNMLQ